METNTAPDRLFHAGDKIRLVKWRGRHPFDLDMDERLEPGYSYDEAKTLAFHTLNKLNKPKEN